MILYISGMRILTEKDWYNVFDNGVISVITSYQLQPKDGFGRYWHPESFRKNCPPDLKAYMIRKYLELKRRGYSNERIGKILYNLPYVKEYNTP
jgi:hypothetical protein